MKYKIPISRPSLSREELTNDTEVFLMGWLGMGALIYEFEEKIGKYFGAKHIISTNTGANVFHLALDFYGIMESWILIQKSTHRLDKILSFLKEKNLLPSVSKSYLDIDFNYGWFVSKIGTSWI